MGMGTKASHPPQRCSLESTPTQYEDDDSNKRSYVIILLSNSEEMTWDNITEAFYYPKWTEPLIFRSQLMGNGSSLLRTYESQLFCLKNKGVLMLRFLGHPLSTKKNEDSEHTDK